MNFEQFKHVIEVSKAGSFNQAANNLFMSQAALSISIKNLESELHQKIFTRNSRGVQLTSFGQEFLSYIIPICVQMEQLEKMRKRTNEKGSLSVAIGSNGYHFLASLCGKLLEKYGSLGLNIYYYDAIGDQVIDLLSEQKIEIGILRIWDCYKQYYRRYFMVKHIEFFPLAKLDLGIMVGKGNPLFYTNKSSITTEELKQYPMVCYNYLDAGPFADIYDRLNMSYSNKIITDSRAVIYDLMEHSNAFYLNSILKIKMDNEGDPSDTRTLLLENCKIKSILGWVKREDSVLSPVAKDLTRDLSECFQDKWYI